MFQTLEEIEQYFIERNAIGIKPGLERVELLLKRVGNPEQVLKAIHVAGTNGKGSTIQFITNSLIANGYRVGVFTSPSFTGVCGHFLKDNKEITEEEMIPLINYLYPHVEALDKKNMHPTSFEIMTVIAFLYFKSTVDITIIETGMGGRYDTTNCVTPLISIITNVAKDHLLFLGSTLEEITSHKAGIVKKNSPVVVGNVKQVSSEIIQKEAACQEAPVFQMYRDFTFEVDQQVFKWTYTDSFAFEFRLQMRGMHQAENAALAMMALVLLQKKGLHMDWSSVVKSLGETVLPGRFEKIYDNPPIILDSAHNVAGIKAFIHTVHSEYTFENKHLIFAGFKDKQLQEMIDKLKGNFRSITITTFNHERAANIMDYTSFLKNRDLKTSDDWQEIVYEIVRQKNVTNEVFFITGSLHFITLVRKLIISLKEKD